jgi:hypothetical protein
MMNKKNFKKIIAGGILTLLLTVGISTQYAKASIIDPPIVHSPIITVEPSMSIDPPIVH